MSDLPPLPPEVSHTPPHGRNFVGFVMAHTPAQMHAYAKEYARLCVLQEREEIASMCGAEAIEWQAHASEHADNRLERCMSVARADSLIDMADTIRARGTP